MLQLPSSTPIYTRVLCHHVTYNKERSLNKSLIARSRWPAWITIIPGLTFNGASIRGKATSSKLEPQPAKRTPGRSMRRIYTLETSRLEPSLFQDISNVKVVRWHPSVGDKEPRASISFTTIDISTNRANRENRPSKVKSRVLPFPEGTRGFLYYLPSNGSESPTTDRNKVDPGRNLDVELSPTDARARLPAVVGRVLFRITDNDDPLSFAAGRDLLLPNGTPWYTVPRKNSGLWRLLARDGFLTDFDKSRGSCRLQNSIISTSAQPFLLDLSRVQVCVYVRSRRDGSLSMLSFDNPFRHRDGNTYSRVYDGVLRCQFERSPEPKHAGTDTFVIRVLEILHPIKRLPQIESDRASFSSSHHRMLKSPSRPKVGELLHRLKKGTLWSFKVPSEKKEMKRHRGWHVLMENEALDDTHSPSEDGRFEG